MQSVPSRTHAVLGALLALLAALAGGAYWIYASLDHHVARALREWGPEVAGVAVTLDGTNIKRTDGRGLLRGLAVANPPGFPAASALRADEVEVEIDVASLGRDVIVVRTLTLIAPEIRLDTGPAGSNLEAIRRNIERHVGQFVPGKSALPAKRLLIESLRLRDARIVLPGRAAGGEAATATLQLHLRDIGKARGGAFPGEIAREIWTPLAQSVALSAVDTESAAARGP